MESDLTELSWLTNNVHSMFKPTPAYYPPQSLTPSAFSCYTRNHFEIARDDDESYLGSSCSSNHSNESSPSTSPCSHYSSSDLINSKLELKNNCGNNKPPLTLSCLIFMAVQESKDKCLPVREIYEWIEDNFPYYKNASNGGWKSSIRHNLSFSKCFKKMDRNESVLHRVKHQENKPSLYNLNGRKKRAPNSTGTCWKVNPECKSYLVQTLKKSAFWFHNSKSYPNLSKYINNYNQNEYKPPPKPNAEVNLKKNNKKLKLADQIDEDDYLNSATEHNNLFEFVQKQQEQLLTKHNINTQNLNLCNFDSNDLAAAAVLAQSDPSKLELILSSSSSSLSSDFSLFSSSSSSSNSSVLFNNKDEQLDVGRKRKQEQLVTQLSINSMNLSSDLEMEVASTLVGMKWLGSKRQSVN